MVVRFETLAQPKPFEHPGPGLEKLSDPAIRDRRSNGRASRSFPEFHGEREWFFAVLRFGLKGGVVIGTRLKKFSRANATWFSGRQHLFQPRRTVIKIDYKAYEFQIQNMSCLFATNSFPGSNESFMR